MFLRILRALDVSLKVCLGTQLALKICGQCVAELLNV